MTRLLGLSPTWLLCFVLDFVPVSSQSTLIRPIPGLPSVNFSRPGDLIIGVVLSLHSYDKDVLCSDVVRKLDALQRLESIVFAVEEINNRSDLLPNVTLGFTILDDCSNEQTALARALHFIQDTSNSSAAGSSGEASLPAVSAVAVIGADGSPQTVELAATLSLFEVPLLSYLSSSSVLDDQARFSYFTRTVPSDNMRAKAIVDILMSFGWTYVSVLYTEGSYGVAGFRTIKENLQSSGYCLAVTRRMMRSFQPKDYDGTVEKLLTQPTARVVVLLMTQEQTLMLFRAVKKLKLYGFFTWVANDCDSMTSNIFDGLELVVSGAISINFFSSPVDRFERHFKHMTLRTGSRNPWFGEFISAIFNCSSSWGPDACDADTEIMASAAYRPEPTASLSFNGVYVVAHALDAIVKNCTLDDVRQCIKPRLLLDTLRTVRFAGEGANISFDDEGNGQTHYCIHNIALINGSLVLNNVGAWDTGIRKFSVLNKHLIRWSLALQLNTTTTSVGDAPPVSVCSMPCPAGQHGVITQPSCCFFCEECLENERTILSEYLPRCETCPTARNFTWPDETRTMCLPIPPTFLQVTRLEGAVLLVFDILVFALTCATIYFYIKNGDHNLMKASSPEISFIILAGHIFACITVVTFLFEPTNATCTITHTAFYLSFTLSYGPLLVKLHCILRVLNSRKTTTKTPSFVSPRCKVSFAACIIFIQILLTSITMMIDNPVALIRMPDQNEKILYAECSEPVVSMLSCNSFNLLLIAVCTFYAFKTRRLQANFKETRFIMICTFSTALLWFAFLPAYFMSEFYMSAQQCLLAILLFSVLSLQVFFFLPKLYVVYFLSKGSMRRQESVPGSVTRL